METTTRRPSLVRDLPSRSEPGLFSKSLESPSVVLLLLTSLIKTLCNAVANSSVVGSSVLLLPEPCVPDDNSCDVVVAVGSNDPWLCWSSKEHDACCCCGTQMLSSFSLMRLLFSSSDTSCPLLLLLLLLSPPPPITSAGKRLESGVVVKDVVLEKSRHNKSS